MKRPNFFIVGLGKCASTSLHHYLKQHPYIGMSSVKEPNYFGSDLLRGKSALKLSEEEYLKLFSSADDKKIIGESSISYISSDKAADEIYNFNPHSKILILLRHPAEQMFSRYEHNFRSPVDPETESSFEEALSEENIRIRTFSDIHRTSSAIIMNVVFYRKNIFELPDRIKKYQTLFGKNNVKIILYEDLVKDTPEIFKDLLRFLGVNDSFKPVFKKFNSTKVRYPILRKILFSKVVIYLRKKISMKIFPNLGRIADRFTIIEIKKGVMKEATRKLLTEEMLPYINRIEALVDRDLSEYKK